MIIDIIYWYIKVDISKSFVWFILISAVLTPLFCDSTRVLVSTVLTPLGNDMGTWHMRRAGFVNEKH